MNNKTENSIAAQGTQNGSVTQHKRWWQETDEVQQQTLHVTNDCEAEEICLSEAHDIGEELEEEARQRALLSGNEITIPFKYTDIYSKCARYSLTLNLVIPILLSGLDAILFINHQFYYPVLILLLLTLSWAFCIMGIFFNRWVDRKIPLSAIVLSRTGIQFHLRGTTYGPVYWDEIAAIFPRRIMGCPYLCIFPKDRNALTERLGIRQSSFPLYISTMNFPMTMETLMAQVTAMKTGAALE